MKTMRVFRGLLSLIMAAALFIMCLPGPVLAEGTEEGGAEETTFSTEASQTTQAPEDPIPTQTTAPTQTTEQTRPEETESPTEAAQIPAEQTEPSSPVSAVTMTPEGGEILPGQDTITLLCAVEGASIYYAVSSDGEIYTQFVPYTAPIVPEADFGTLHVKAYAEKEGYLNSSETVCVFTQEKAAGWQLYFGQLHAHTNLSDGTGSVTEAFQYAANVAGLDFFAVTDHSNSFDNADAGTLAGDGSAVSADWAAGKAAAASVTGGDFVGIFGYEMTWQEGKHLGHINTFNTPGWLSRNQEEYKNPTTALENYYKALSAVPGSVSQFNHPGTAYGEFENFAHYTAAYDEVVHLLEVGSEGGYSAYHYYTRALDAGWHVAPTNNQNNHNGSWGDASAARTVVLADTLTEKSLYEAMRQHRVYATQDSDLTILYQLDGHIMGSVLPASQNPQISVYISDPTDGSIGRVEVIVDGGAVAAQQTVEASSGTVTLTPPGGHSYYYIRITQPDGDIAVTAPVWMDRAEDIGISGFSADTALPVQGQALQLSLALYNNEKTAFHLESLTFTADGVPVHTAAEPGTIDALDTFVYTFPYTHPGMGVTDFHAVAVGTVNGETRTYEASLGLHYRTQETVTNILVDCSHGNLGTDALKRLREVAAQTDVGVTAFTGQLPESGNVLLVCPPAIPFGEDFLEAVAEFAASGGSVIVCGQSDAGDGTLHTSQELNRLLAAIGSTLRLHDDTAIDEVNNGGQSDALYSQVFNREASWCAGLSDGQFYSQHAGCTVDAGSGDWLVKGFPTTQSADKDADGLTGQGAVLLACEEMPGGGTVFAAGGLFLSDGEMKESRNRWDPVSANQAVLEKLLDIERVSYPVSSIADARKGQQGDIFRIRGYVTAGTANRYNTFPETIYLQDDTGGIAVVPFTEEGIQVGTPMEVVGYWNVCQGNPALEIIGYEVLGGDLYRYTPRTMLHANAMDYASHGAQLLQVQGEVVDVVCSADGKGVVRFTLKDVKGDMAVVMIEDDIRSGSDGENTLASEVKPGRAVRAMGILHLDAAGQPVLRVRNCEEVVYVPPIPDPTNPKTGDHIVIAAAAAAVSALMVRKRRRK